MTRSNVEKRLDLAVARAVPQCRSFKTSASHRTPSGTRWHASCCNPAWLQHHRSVARARESKTTHRYVEADLAMKEKALARLDEPSTRLRRYRPPDPCCGSCSSYNYGEFEPTLAPENGGVGSLPPHS